MDTSINKEMREEILVSVVMTTYNDAEFIVRTLESIKAQTYRNIELVISDDKSSDNTIEVANTWLCDNMDRFVAVKVIVPERNTGVTENCIRAVRASEGVWIKNVGGDNIIKPDCIEKFVEFVSHNPEAELVQCCIGFIDEFDVELKERENELDSLFFDCRISSEEQLQLFTYNYYVSALSLFKKKSLLDSMECYDIEFKNQEDTAFAFRVLGAGHKIFGMNNRLIYKRMRTDSLSQQNTSIFVRRNDIVTTKIRLKYIYYSLDIFDKICLRITDKYQNLIIDSKYNYYGNPISFLLRTIRYPMNIYHKWKLRNLRLSIQRRIETRNFAINK